MTLCVIFQVGHSLRQDAARSNGWTSFLGRLNKASTLQPVWSRIFTGVRRVLVADLPALLVRLALGANLVEVEALVSSHDTGNDQ